jgi:hypothetical protein
MTDLLDLLDTLWDDSRPLAVEQHDRIFDAIVTAASLNDGIVNPNHVRKLLSNEHGLQVNPRVLSSAYSALRRRGVIQPDGWVTNDDIKGKNGGKPLRIYRYVE